MNIFYLHRNPKECAEYHCDKHAVKMIIEYAQLMSTAHRILDGIEYIDKSSGRRIKRWKLDDDREEIVYRASHINHPSAIWVRQNNLHYDWLYNMWTELLNEYSRRYQKIHKTGNLTKALSITPKNIPNNLPWQDPPPAMPEECKVKGNSIESYRNYYVMKKYTFARWNYTQVPDWYSDMILSEVANESQKLGLYD